MQNMASTSEVIHRQNRRSTRLRSTPKMIMILIMVCGLLGLFSLDTSDGFLTDTDDVKNSWLRFVTQPAPLNLNTFETHSGHSSWFESQVDIILNSGCFISASATEFAGIGLILGICMMGLLIGLRLIIQGCAENDADRNPIQRP